MLERHLRLVLFGRCPNLHLSLLEAAESVSAMTDLPPRTLAVGDIHGCHTALTTLLAAVAPRASDQIVFLGDYIDRGPGSRQVIDILIGLETSISPIFLRGNHEVMVLESREDPLKANLWQSYGGFEALLSYSTEFPAHWQTTIPGSHWRFFERTARYHETDTHIFVHACVDPDLEMTEQDDWPLLWEFFDRMKPHKSGKPVICGHTPQLSGQILDAGYALCIDTAACSGGWLTCLDVVSRNYWQANERGQTRQGVLSAQR